MNTEPRMVREVDELSRMMDEDRDTCRRALEEAEVRLLGEDLGHRVGVGVTDGVMTEGLNRHERRKQAALARKGG